jgi:hypothetical protein
MPRYNDALKGTSTIRNQKMSPEDQLQGMINQGPMIGSGYVNRAKMIELHRQIEQNKLMARSVDKGVGLATDNILFPRLDTYGIKKGTVKIGGVQIA